MFTRSPASWLSKRDKIRLPKALLKRISLMYYSALETEELQGTKVIQKLELLLDLVLLHSSTELSMEAIGH